MNITPQIKKLAPFAILLAAALIGYGAWKKLHTSNEIAGFASGNGRIEATEIDIATKLPGRLDEVLVAEGAFVKAGQPLARMQLQSLQAQRDEALARLQQAQQTVAGYEAQVAVRETEMDAAQRRLKRTETLVQEGASSRQELDDDRARFRGAQAVVTSTKAQVTAGKAAVNAAQATVARIDADLQDSELKAPRDARVQFLVAQPGEVLGGGGKVLNLVDLSDVYLTFFLPETIAGRVSLGSEARIVLDATPNAVIPAKISYVSSVAQFTPKTVETASERQKLMFRVKAQIDPKLLQKNLEQVKTGLPGVAWVQIDPQAAWPEKLAIKAAP